MKDRSYSPLRPLVNANKVYIDGTLYNDKESNQNRKDVYNKFKERANSPSITKEQKGLADFIIENLAKDQLGSDPNKRYGSLKYVNLLSKKNNSSDGLYENGKITLDIGKPQENPLITAIHEGTHSLDNDYMRIYQKEAIDYLADLENQDNDWKTNYSSTKKTENPLIQLIKDTQEINPSQAFRIKYYPYSALKNRVEYGFKPNIEKSFGTINEWQKKNGSSNPEVTNFKGAQQGLKAMNESKINPTNLFDEFSEFPAFGVEQLYNPWKQSNNPRANAFLHKMMTGVQRDFGELGMNGQKHPDMYKAFKDRLAQLQDPLKGTDFQAPLKMMNPDLKRKRK
jgi:hypothetical protein